MITLVFPSWLPFLVDSGFISHFFMAFSLSFAIFTHMFRFFIHIASHQ